MSSAVLIGEPSTTDSSSGENLVETTEQGFPDSISIQFDVPEEDFLFVHGEWLRGTIEISWQMDDTLRFAGLPVYPSRKPPITADREKKLSTIYADVPYMKSKVLNESLNWHQALAEWEKKRNKLRLITILAYRDSWRAERSQELAREAANIAFDLSKNDFSDIVDTETSLEWRNGDLFYPWIGVRRPVPSSESFIISQSDMSESATSYSIPSKYENIIGRIASIIEPIKWDGPSFTALHSAGGVLRFSSPVMPAEEFRKRRLVQIDGSAMDNYLPGPIELKVLKEIVASGGFNQ